MLTDDELKAIDADDEILRCNICGFVIDGKYEAEKPKLSHVVKTPRNQPDDELARLRAEIERLQGTNDELERLCDLRENRAINTESRLTRLLERLKSLATKAEVAQVSSKEIQALIQEARTERAPD